MSEGHIVQESITTRSRQRAHNRMLIAVFAFCSVLIISTYPLLWRNAPFVATDTGGYVKVANDLAAHHFLAFLHPRTIGYPLFLLLTGTGKPYLYWMLAFYCVAAGVSVIALRRLGVRSVLVFGFLFVFLSPINVQNTANLLTEGLTNVSLSIGLALTIFWILAKRDRYCWLASFCF